MKRLCFLWITYQLLFNRSSTRPEVFFYLFFIAVFISPKQNKREFREKEIHEDKKLKETQRSWFCKSVVCFMNGIVWKPSSFCSGVLCLWFVFCFVTCFILQIQIIGKCNTKHRQTTPGQKLDDHQTIPIYKTSCKLVKLQYLSLLIWYSGVEFNFWLLFIFLIIISLQYWLTHMIFDIGKRRKPNTTCNDMKIGLIKPR